MAASCLAARADEIVDRLVDGVTAAGLGDIAVKRVGCLGLCAAGPLVEIPETGRLFERVTPDDVAPVVADLAADGGPVERARSLPARSGSSPRTSAGLIPRISMTPSLTALTRPWSRCCRA
jgi:(2Fe-2S) ferredoxin